MSTIRSFNLSSLVLATMVGGCAVTSTSSEPSAPPQGGFGSTTGGSTTTASTGSTPGGTTAQTTTTGGSTTTGTSTGASTTTSSTGSTTGTSTGAATTCPTNVTGRSAAESLTNQSDGTYPRLAQLADGDILASFTRFTASNGNTINSLVVSRSHAGRAFEELGPIYSAIGDIDNAFILQIPYQASPNDSNRLIAVFRNHSRTETNGTSTYTTYRISLSSSDDSGDTWSSPVNVLTAAATPANNGLWEPYLFNAPDGSLQLYYSRETSSSNQVVGMVRSTDNAQTWSTEIIVAQTGVTRDGMPSVTPYYAGDQNALLAVYESGNAGQYSIWSSKSLDSGLTWQDRALVYAPAGSHNAGAPQVGALSTTSLVVIFMTDEDASTIAWPAHASAKVLTTQTISSSALTWGGEFLVSPATTYWPSLLTNGKGTALACYQASYVVASPLQTGLVCSGN